MSEKDLNTSKSVQEIIGAVPSIFTKWGNVFMLSFLIAMVISCFYITYPDIIESRATIIMTKDFSEIRMHKKGQIVKVFVPDKSFVSENLPLLVVKYFETSNDTLKSNRSGKIYYEKDLSNSLVAQKNELLMTQAPNSYDYEIRVKLNMQQHQKVNLQQIILISIPGLSNRYEDVIKTKINFISPIRDNYFQVSSKLNKSLSKKLSLFSPTSNEIECNVQIVIENKSIAQKLFSKLIN